MYIFVVRMTCLMWFVVLTLHFPLLDDFLVCLDLIADLEIRPGFEAHAALGALAHLRDVLLDVFEGGECACQGSVQASKGFLPRQHLKMENGAEWVGIRG